MGLYEGSITTPPQPHLANVPGVVMLLKNFGQTPGYKTVSWIQVAVIEPINEDKLVVPEIADKSSLTLPSNGTSTKTLYYSGPLTTTEISDVLKGIRSIYVYVRVEYRDVYGKSITPILGSAIPVSFHQQSRAPRSLSPTRETNLYSWCRISLRHAL
jgi:hypothetical protein